LVFEFGAGFGLAFVSEKSCMRILITFAVDAEFAPWRSIRKFTRVVADDLNLWKSSSGNAEVYVLLTGIGDDTARVMDLMMRVASIRQYFDLCVSSGLAGALHSDYELGEIVVAKILKSARIHKDLERDWLETDKPLLEMAVSLGAKWATFYTAAAVVTTAEEKGRLAAVADVVEMESFDVVKGGCLRGARCTAIRAISDRSGEDLPINFNKTISSEHQVSIPRVLAQVAKNPVSLGPLIRFGKRSRRAAESLAHFLEAFLNSIVQNVETVTPVKVAAR
jgi:nucleoside phosphorylase